MDGRHIGPLPDTDSTVLRANNFPSMREIFPSLDEPDDGHVIDDLLFVPEEDLLELSEEEEDEGEEAVEQGDDFWENLTSPVETPSWNTLLSALQDQIAHSQNEESRQEILSALQRLLQNSPQQPARSPPATPPER